MERRAADIEVLSEREQGAGWQFAVAVTDRAGARTDHSLSLAWADYNLWSPGGADPPVAVARAVVRFLLACADGARLRPAFDASIARRLHASADREIPALIEDGERA
jgi:hypothetical protein